MRLNPVQLVAARAYGNAEELLLVEDLTHSFPRGNITRCGDTLFRFLMLELEDCTNEPEEALKRVTVARRQLEDVERAIFTKKSGLWE